MRLSLAVVAGVLGLVIVLGVIARRRWLAQAHAAADADIQKNRAVRKPEFAKVDDSLRVRTNARREAADRMRARAAHVESGASASQVMRMVAKR